MNKSNLNQFQTKGEEEQKNKQGGRLPMDETKSLQQTHEFQGASAQAKSIRTTRTQETVPYTPAQTTRSQEPLYIPAQTTGSQDPPYIPTQITRSQDPPYIPAQTMRSQEPQYIPAQTTRSEEPPYITAQITGSHKPPYILVQTTRSQQAVPYVHAQTTRSQEPLYIPGQTTGSQDPPYIPAQTTRSQQAVLYVHAQTTRSQEPPYIPAQTTREQEPPYITGQTTRSQPAVPYTPAQTTRSHDPSYILPAQTTGSQEPLYIPTQTTRELEPPYIPEQTTRLHKPTYIPAQTTQTQEPLHVSAQTTHSKDAVPDVSVKKRMSLWEEKAERSSREGRTSSADAKEAARLSFRTNQYNWEEKEQVQQEVDGKAIPLCLPNNLKWDPLSGKICKIEGERVELYAVDTAVEQLKQIKGPICVVAIAGPCREGKSYLLSKVFGQPNVFSVGHNMDPKTMGIWMWICPAKFKDSDGKEITVLLLDTEGKNAVTAEGLNDDQIFTLTVLLASVLIYNSLGVPKKTDLEGLDYIVKLSERIQIRSDRADHHDDKELFSKMFPFFVWTLRDMTQALPGDCKDIKDYFLTRVFKEGKDVAESILNYFSGFDAFCLPPPSTEPEIMSDINKNTEKLSPKFRDGIMQLEDLLKTKLAPKRINNNGEFITGEGLASLLLMYVDAINDPDGIPNVQTAWDTFVQNKCREAKITALETYDEMMRNLLAQWLPCDGGEVLKSHSASQNESMNLFGEETNGISSTSVERDLNELTEITYQRLETWKQKNEKLTRTNCEELLRKLKQEHLDPVFERIRQKDGSEVCFSEVMDACSSIKRAYDKQAIGTQSTRAEVFFDFNENVVQPEMKQHEEILRKMKDYQAKLLEENCARASAEKEKTIMAEKNAELKQMNKDNKEQMRRMEEKQKTDLEELRNQGERQKTELKAQHDSLAKAGLEREEKLKGSIQKLEEKTKTMERKRENDLKEQRNRLTKEGERRENRIKIDFATEMDMMETRRKTDLKEQRDSLRKEGEERERGFKKEFAVKMDAMETKRNRDLKEQSDSLRREGERREMGFKEEFAAKVTELKTQTTAQQHTLSQERIKRAQAEAREDILQQIHKEDKEKTDKLLENGRKRDIEMERLKNRGFFERVFNL